jgi:hypothetical protein
MCPIGTGASFPGVKAAVASSWPLTSIYCQGQEWWSYTSTFLYVFMAWCLTIKHRDNLTFKSHTLFYPVV